MSRSSMIVDGGCSRRPNTAPLAEGFVDGGSEVNVWMG
jgi:hypothetical protein